MERVATGEAVLAVQGLAKYYPGTTALDDVSLTVHAGEVRALLGKNGAGKSTLVKILSGVVQPDRGKVLVDGRPVTLSLPAKAREEGIVTVHQDLGILPDLSIAENLFVGGRNRLGIVRQGTRTQGAKRLLARVGSDLDPRTRAGDLSPHNQQLVAIARALGDDPRVLILDEPTSALHSSEVDRLLALVRALAAEGTAIIYISHRLDEIPRVANSVTVLRDGRQIATTLWDETDIDTVVAQMLGRTLERESARPNRTGDASPGPEALTLRDVTTTKLRRLNLTVHRGEIVGLWGMPGCGRSEVFHVCFGLRKGHRGVVTVDGELLKRDTPAARIGAGMGFSPDDRKRYGLVNGMTVAENLVLACPKLVSRWGVISQRRQRRLAQTEVVRLGIKTASLRVSVGALSGGNQQKLVVGRWLASSSRVLLLDEPTKGVDVGAKAELYRVLCDLREGGLAVLVAPTEVEELFVACDRILVMRDGQIVLETTPSRTTPETLMAVAMGGDERR